MRSEAVMLSAGEEITESLTDTRPAVIHASASRRDARPARAMTLAMRSPAAVWEVLSPTVCLSRSCPALCRASTSLYTSDIEDVDGRDKPSHDDACLRSCR